MTLLTALDIVANSFQTQGQCEFVEEVLLRVYKGDNLIHEPLHQHTLDIAADLASIYELDKIGRTL